MFKALLLSLALSNGADATTSIMAFRRGAGEINPFVVSTNTAPFLTQVSLATAGKLWLANKFHPTHPKLVKGLMLVSIGAGLAASRHNLQVYHTLGPR